MISKIQYEGFEDGEYIEEKVRTFEELISLIQNFPFSYNTNKQLVFTVENSICLSIENGDLLKIMSFHTERFDIWYYSIHDKLYYAFYINGREKLIALLEDIYQNNFFSLEQYEIVYTKSDKELLNSFYTKDFNYSINNRWVKFLFFNCVMEVIAFCIGIYFFISSLIERNVNYGFLLFFALSLPGLLIYLNYYFKSKDYILILSKGSPTFQFGKKNTLQTFNKNEIARFEEVGITQTRSPLNQFYYLIIKMKNGAKIIIPNILISELELMIKFPKLNGSTRKKNPIIRAKSLITQS